MTRYITTDTITGEIIARTNRHPLLDPLRPRRTPRAGLRLKRRRVTHNERELAYTVILMVFAVAFWYYALYM